MDIELIKKIRRDLELKILAEIKVFQNKTGLVVTSIDTISTNSHKGPRIEVVSIKAEII
jgi:hypothetical protein